jgi:hypothetical protein
MSDALPDPIKPGQQYAQSVIVKDLPDGAPIQPFGEPNVSYKKLPEGAQQVLQWRFFVQDDQTGEWHIGMSFPAGGTQVRPAKVTRGQDAGIAESGYVLSPPGSPPLPPEGSGKNPPSGIRLGSYTKYTGQAYFRVYNAGGQPISPVTGRTVTDESQLGHYPLDPYESKGPR